LKNIEEYIYEETIIGFKQPEKEEETYISNLKKIRKYFPLSWADAKKQFKINIYSRDDYFKKEYKLSIYDLDGFSKLSENYVPFGGSATIWMAEDTKKYYIQLRKEKEIIDEINIKKGDILC